MHDETSIFTLYQISDETGNGQPGGRISWGPKEGTDLSGGEKRAADQRVISAFDI